MKTEQPVSVVAEVLDEAFKRKQSSIRQDRYGLASLAGRPAHLPARDVRSFWR